MRNYNSSAVEIGWLGLDLKDGLAAGSFITYQDSAPRWSYIKDGLGGGIRVFNEDSSGEIQIIIDVETRVHQLLLFYSGIDSQAKNIQGPLILIDRNTNQTTIFTNAYIVNDPSETRGTESISATWVFAYTARRTVPAPDLGFADANVV